MKKKAKNILITIAVTIGILVVLEVVSRVILSKVYNRQFDSSLIEEHKYGSTSGLKANATGTVWGKPFHTDDMGGRKHTKSKAGKHKTLVIGDSVIEGVGLEDSATISNAYNEGNGFDEEDVRNISMIGWSTYDYRNVVDELVGKDTSIKTVYLFYCLNDIYGKFAIKDLPPIANKGFASAINGFLQDRYATYKLIKLLAYSNSDHYYQYDLAMYEDTAKVNAVVTDVVHIKEVCEANNVRFMIFLVPYRSQLEHRNNNQPQQLLTELFTKKGIRGMDLLRQWPQEDNYSDLFLFADEIHLSAKGHKEMGRAIYEK
ncbi:MAG: hypothetical protein JWO03_688 [Bacteroidetes bacterium]|nr:hypothetical protein [Bacteroidota bacterium]